MRIIGVQTPAENQQLQREDEGLTGWTLLWRFRLAAAAPWVSLFKLKFLACD